MGPLPVRARMDQVRGSDDLVVALVVGGFVDSPSARAAITGSQITTPSNPSFFIADEDASSQALAISGTTTGGNPASDKVDVRCYFGGTSVKVKGNVPLNSNGSFSVPTADLNKLIELTCQLRAVPAGTTPADLTPFAGPVIGVGDRETSKVSGGANNGKAYDYNLDAQQQTAAFDYVSLGSCGLHDGFLYDPTYANTTVTFACNAGLERADTPSTPTRSELQIDGVNAYAPAQAFFINSSAAGFPSLTDTYTVDKATGNVVVQETDPLVKCTGATYPPSQTSCATFVSTGVTDNRTITQDHDGHISWITDVFKSTDGKAHSLDLLWENNQRFWGASGDSSSSSTSSRAKAASRHMRPAPPSRCRPPRARSSRACTAPPTATPRPARARSSTTGPQPPRSSPPSRQSAANSRCTRPATCRPEDRRGSASPTCTTTRPPWSPRVRQPRESSS